MNIWGPKMQENR